MKTILLSLTAAAALAAAVVPATAQPYGYGADRGQTYEQPRAYEQQQAYGYAPGRHVMGRLTGLDRRIQDAAQERRISWGQARDLRSDLQRVRPIAWRIENGRASGWERQRLETTVSRVEYALNRYAQNDRYDDHRDDHRDWRR